MFSLSDHPANLTNLNVRIERYGDDRKLAADLKFILQAGNATLDSIEPGLRESLFRKPGSGEQQALPIDGNSLTAVKFPSLAPIKLTHEFPGYEIDLSVEGFADREPLPLVDVTVKKIEVAPLEGGSVSITFTASTGVEPEDLAELCDALVRESVRLTVTPPSAKAAGDGGESGDTLDAQDASEEAARLVEEGKKAA